MARDRQRAKQRRARRRDTVPPGGAAPDPQVPGAPPANLGQGAPISEPSPELDESDPELTRAALESRRVDSPVGPPGPVGEVATADRGRAGLPRRFAGFLRASWAELQRVQWPNRRQVSQATGVVLGFVIVAGAYLGLADFVADKIVSALL